MEAPSLIGITCVTLSEQYVPYSHGILILHKVDIRNNNSNNNNTSAFYANMFFIWKSLTFRIRREDQISPTAEEYQLSMTTFEPN